MGAWGTGIFDNDPAGDWACELEEADFTFVRDSIETVLEEADHYIEVDVGCMGLAACEVVAMLKGNPGAESEDGMTAPALERVNQWVKQNPQTIDDELIQQCLQVVDAVKGKDSESAELWEEAEEDYAQWIQVVDDLRSRLM